VPVQHTLYTMGTNMQVRIRLFAAHREAAGQDDYVADLPSGTHAHDVPSLLEGRFPGLSAAAPSFAYAVNLKQVPGDTELHDGDELALLPPLAGG
jgi:molybdopterin converting factor small subunit